VDFDRTDVSQGKADLTVVMKIRIP